LTHGFDNTGRALDKFGNYYEQFDSNATNEQYEERAKCFVEQYGRHTIPELADTNIDGELTLDENIADNGGLREALFAYRLYELKFGAEELLPGFEDFTSEQLFFLSFGNVRVLLNSLRRINLIF
jgi:predicted metalloendopeptidase